MNNKFCKVFLILMILTLLPLTMTGCDLLEESAESFEAEVKITGLETPEHYHVFTVAVEDGGSGKVTWEEGDAEDNKLEAFITDLEGESTLELIIADEDIDGSYELESKSSEITVDKDNNRAEFEVKLDYTPRSSQVDITSEPEAIYIPAEKDSEEEYIYSAEILDQYDNTMKDEEINWSLKDETPELEIEAGVLTVPWNAKAGQIEILAYTEEDPDIYQEKPVNLEYLPEEKAEIYDKAGSSLEDKMAEYDLDAVEEDFALPDSIEVYDQEKNEYIEFTTFWSSEEHEAITIEDNTAKLIPVLKDTTGYIKAFIQPAESAEVQVDDDPRQKSFQVTVLEIDEEEAQLKVDFDFEHSYPASEVDDYYDLQSLESMQGPELSKEFDYDRTLEEKKVPGQFIVGVHNASTLQDTKSSLEEQNYTVLDSNNALNALLVSPPYSMSSAKAESELKTLSAVRYVEPNKYLYALSTNHPEAELYPEEQWHYPQIRLPQTWSQNTGDDNVRVAILDTGVDVEHPDLENYVDTDAAHNFGAYDDDVVTGNEDPEETPDIQGHGTHVAGTVAASSNGGTAGTMWQGELIPVKVLGNDDQGTGTLWSISRGILYAAGFEVEVDDNESVSLPSGEAADIINLSLGGAGGDIMHDAVQQAYQEGVLIVGASGNNGISGLIVPPASYPEVISVGSTNYNYPDEPERASHSNISDELDLLAPGGSGPDEDFIWSTHTTHPDNEHSDYEYAGMVGTSMAAPHVSGVAGLMLSEGIAPGEVRDILKETSMDLSTVQYDAGLINAYWAINEVDRMQVKLYRDDGGEMEKVEEKIVPIDEDEVEFDILRPGDYEIEVHVDVQDTGSLDPGDYSGIYESLNLELGEDYDIDLTMEEYSD